MDFYSGFYTKEISKPFADYSEYMDTLFAWANISLDFYIENLKEKYTAGEGAYKNIFYPDLEVAQNLCQRKMLIPQFEEQKELPFMDEMLSYISGRAESTVNAGIKLPFYELCQKLCLRNFTVFCFTLGILASTQTDYAAVFQIVNENGNLPVPTVESGAKLYFGPAFSLTKAYSDMSLCLEELTPLLNLQVPENMPFSAEISLDKRIIDFLFGKKPLQTDANYIRFFSLVPPETDPAPILANQWLLEAMEISFKENIRIFSLTGDEGSGRKFFLQKFCKNHGFGIISLNCGKLFSHDYEFTDKALWALTRECILTDSCCLLELSSDIEEKENFREYLDMAVMRLSQKNIPLFFLSPERLPLKDIAENAAELNFPLPDIREREECWKYFAQGYPLDAEIDFSQMASKFLFTPGKIKDSFNNSKSLSIIRKSAKISKDDLFSGCYNQVSSNLTLKASKIKTHFGFEDIVMNREQKEIIKHAINQVTFQKQIYEDWNYKKKYPSGQGMSLLLFGAPGTGKSMCAQVIAQELNLELYRVDLSKVLDKYIGETEKSIYQIFHEAKKCNVILFFDECDALFSKRSDEGSSIQAFHNSKAALLLQEIEAYNGISILATNHKNSIDPAFFRRMKYVVEFQFPDAATRELLWRQTIPKDTPLGDDVDIPFLAEKFEFAGGNIKNCILNAAFLAAAEGPGTKVHMRHYLKAVRYEYMKTGKIYTKTDFNPYAEEVFHE